MLSGCLHFHAHALPEGRNLCAISFDAVVRADVQIRGRGILMALAGVKKMQEEEGVGTAMT